MLVRSTDEPQPDAPERSKLIARLREKNPKGRSVISTASRSPGATDEEVCAEIRRVLEGMEDGTIPYTVHDSFPEDVQPKQVDWLTDPLTAQS